MNASRCLSPGIRTPLWPIGAMVGLALTFAADPARACEEDYKTLKEAELNEIESGEALIRRIVTEKLSEKDLTADELKLLERIEAIQESRTRPVDDADLAILQRADEILAGESVWDRADDRKCAGGDAKVSLFCALKFASEEIIGTYEHRRTALQEVRFAIEEKSGGKQFGHRMQDYNNAATTSFADIKEVLRIAITRVRERLNLQAQCAL